MVAAFVFAIYMAIKEIRDDRQDGVIRFAPAFGYGVLVVFIAYAVMVGYLLVHYTCIEKDGVEKNNRRNVELAYSRLKKEMVTDDEVRQYYADVKVLVEKERRNVEADSVCGVKLDSATQILLTAYQRQLVEKPHDAEDPAYRLDSFSVKANELLYRCAEAVLANANEENRECLALLPVMLDNSSRNIQGLDPLVARFEKVKPTFAYSLSILLYGLLLNIFVALFLYRNEKRKCSLDSEDDSENTEEPTSNH